MSSKARVALASVLFIGFLFGAVFPTKTYLAQRQEIAAAAERLALFERQNGRLAAEVERLGRDEEIERIARGRYNLVKPGEEAYAVVPVPDPPPTQEPLAPRSPADPDPDPDPTAPAPAPAPAPALAERKQARPVLAWVRDTLRRFF